MLDKVDPNASGAIAPTGNHSSTMAELMVAIERDPILSATRKRDLVSAVRSFCRLLKLEPSATPASHAYFRRHVQRFNHLTAGTSRKTFQNVQALVSAALQRFGTAKQPVRQELSLEWQELQDRLRGNP